MGLLHAIAMLFQRSACRQGLFVSRCLLLSAISAVLLPPSFVAVTHAQSPSEQEGVETPVLLGQEYDEHSSDTSATPQAKPFWKKVILFLPNRLLDAIDIVKADVGVGPATGAVVRVTTWGQAGYRSFAPGSLRVGLRGRHMPVFFERSAELGIGPVFMQSHDREVTPLEVGAGVDVLLVGAYLGVSIDELFDFFGGWVGLDFKDDDL